MLVVGLFAVNCLLSIVWCLLLIVAACWLVVSQGINPSHQNPCIVTGWPLAVVVISRFSCPPRETRRTIPDTFDEVDLAKVGCPRST